MRLPVLLTVSALGLAACAPVVPDSAASYDSYLRERELAATRPAPIVPPSAGFSTDVLGAAIDRADGRLGGAPTGAPPPFGPQPGTGSVIGSAPVSGAVIGATSTGMAASVPAGGLDASRPRGNAPLTIQEQSGEMIHARPAGISDENDFNAVSQRETIESDAERIARNRAQYVVIPPGALPTRPGELGPNVVDYALATNHPVGTQLYRRSSFSLTNTQGACMRFASPDLAQQEFLRRGGPDRDRLGLDPDGDGYACGWDPSPFRIR